MPLTDQDKIEIDAAVAALKSSEGHTIPIGRHHMENLLRICKRIADEQPIEPPIEPSGEVTASPRGMVRGPDAGIIRATEPPVEPPNEVAPLESDPPYRQTP